MARVQRRLAVWDAKREAELQLEETARLLQVAIVSRFGMLADISRDKAEQLAAYVSSEQCLADVNAIAAAENPLDAPAPIPAVDLEAVLALLHTQAMAQKSAFTGHKIKVEGSQQANEQRAIFEESQRRRGEQEALARSARLARTIDLRLLP